MESDSRNSAATDAIPFTKHVSRIMLSYTEGLSVWKRNQFTTEKLQGTVGPDERFPTPGSTKSADPRQAKDLMP